MRKSNKIRLEPLLHRLIRVVKLKTNRDMIKLNSDKGRKVISDYITALNGDEESIKWAYDKRKAEYDIYDDALKDSVDKCFDCI